MSRRKKINRLVFVIILVILGLSVLLFYLIDHSDGGLTYIDYNRLVSDAQKTKDKYLSQSEAQSMGIKVGFVEYKVNEGKYMSIPGALYEVQSKNEVKISQSWFTYHGFVKDMTRSYSFVRYLYSEKGENTTYMKDDLVCQINNTDQLYVKSCKDCAESLTDEYSCSQTKNKQCYYKASVVCGYLTDSIVKDYESIYPILSEDYSRINGKGFNKGLIYYVLVKEGNFIVGRTQSLDSPFGGDSWLLYHKNDNWNIVLSQSGDADAIPCKNAFVKYKAPEKYKDYFFCSDI